MKLYRGDRFNAHGVITDSGSRNPAVFTTDEGPKFVNLWSRRYVFVLGFLLTAAGVGVAIVALLADLQRECGDCGDATGQEIVFGFVVCIIGLLTVLAAAVRLRWCSTLLAVVLLGMTFAFIVTGAYLVVPRLRRSLWEAMVDHDASYICAVQHHFECSGYDESCAGAIAPLPPTDINGTTTTMVTDTELPSNTPTATATTTGGASLKAASIALWMATAPANGTVDRSTPQCSPKCEHSNAAFTNTTCEGKTEKTAKYVGALAFAVGAVALASIIPVVRMVIRRSADDEDRMLLRDDRNRRDYTYDL